MKREIWIACAIAAECLCAASTLGAASKPHHGFIIISQSSEGWMVQYTPHVPPTTSIDIDGVPHILFPGAASLDGGIEHAGEPLLPIDVVTFGVPPKAIIQAELVEPVYETIPNQLVAPIPTYAMSGDTQIVADYRKNQRAYSENRFYPSHELLTDSPTLLRDQWMVNVRISPYMYNPATKTLRRLVRATLVVKLNTSERAELPLRSPTPDPFFEPIYHSTIVNYEQARIWRVQKMKSEMRPAIPDPTRDWFETGRDYYKIPIARDGWYRVTKAQLVAAGALPSQIDVPTMKMFYRGAEVPIVIRPDTSVEFYGRANRGDSTYTDFFTDTSAYWLTWGGANGLRFSPSLVDAIPPITTSVSEIVTRHFEQNNYYFTGTTIQDVINVETVPGEGWAWGTPDLWFFPNSTREYDFMLDDIDSLTSRQATIRVRLVSTTLNYTTPNHRARIWLVDSSATWYLGEVTFAGRATGMFTAMFPHSYLKNGRNVLRIQSLNTGASPNQFYLDWFEVEYNRSLRASGNQTEFMMPASGSLTRTTFRASGFTSPRIDVFDLATKRAITGVQITASGGGEYEIAFRDTLLGSRHYIVVAEGGALPVLSVTRKQFADIRVNAQGADYVIITHRAFMSAAQQLAAHRQAVNGVRTAVIDVDAIYDEFNYGIMNGTKLKHFIKHAYDFWQAPRPSYLLLFGDACWDYHRFLSSTIKTNYVPSYGVPVTDNWYVSFNPDTGAMPFMFVGRIPVATPQQATETVQKIIGYDNYTLGEWNKNFLFITGGIDPSEQSLFNLYSEMMIGNKVAPPPIAGTPFRVYKTTRGAIDGEHKERLKELVRNGLVFMNFIGHSGGRIWGVDIGPPSELENTDGKLPFVSSTSCNVGGFAEPSSNVLAEDFLIASNRGAIGTWASSTLGFPGYGKDLTLDFLQGVRDSLRALGPLTTVPRIAMLRRYGNDYISVSTVHSNNLIGDPLSRFALPLAPDLAVRAADIVPSNPVPTPRDTLVNVNVKLYNYGLVPTDSVGVTVTDLFNGQTTTLVNNRMLAPTRQVDSLLVPWRRLDQVGLHTLSVTLDPEARIPEVNELNNIASREQYVYANTLSIVKPIRNMVVPPGIQRLVVTSPFGVDSSGFTYEFQLDTVDTFDSPALISSGSLAPGPVTGEWMTPSLASNQVYFWRARASYPQTLGSWVVSSFSTADDAPALPAVRWRERTRKQFQRDQLVQLAATDSGVTIAPTIPVNLYVRSVGTRYNQLAEYYSIIKVNEQQIRGYFFEAGVGTGFLAMRLNDFTGQPDFRTFNTPAFPPDSGLAHARRMLAFINETPVGNYLAFSVIFDGATGVTESLKVALEELGSTRIRQVQRYMSYVLVVRKGASGGAMPALEALTNDTAVVAMSVPNLYRAGQGAITTQPMFIAPSWIGFHWRHAGEPATNAQLAFVGVRSNGSVDTLRVLPRDSVDVDLSFLNTLTSGEQYSSLRTTALLSTADATITPTLREWWMDLVAPADLAVSARTIGGHAASPTRNIEVTVHNIGFQQSDSSTVMLSLLDRQNRVRHIASMSLPPIPLGSSRSVVIPLATKHLQRRISVQAVVVPSSRSKDLVAENNTAYYSFDNIVLAYRGNVKLYVDGAEIMEGDYVPATPTLVVRIPEEGETLHTAAQAKLFVDERLAAEWQPTATAPGATEHPTFAPQLNDGYHRLRFTILRANTLGAVDTVEHEVGVNVSRANHILNVYNYPNPFTSDTYITLMLAGSTPPDELTLRIYTVAGRKIREISVSQPRIGFNRVYWDGRDADGDEVANGYYLYQVTMRTGGSSETAMQKLVKVK